jgi:tetratricopeptide (TPR) repeat protein
MGIRCEAHLALNEPEDARKACTAAIRTGERLHAWSYYNNLGVAELQLGNLAEAEKHLRRAAELDGWSWGPRQNLELLRQRREADLIAAEQRWVGAREQEIFAARCPAMPTLSDRALAIVPPLQPILEGGQQRRG